MPVIPIKRRCTYIYDVDSWPYVLRCREYGAAPVDNYPDGILCNHHRAEFVKSFNNHPSNSNRQQS